MSVVSFGTTCFHDNRSFLGHIAIRSEARIIQLCRGATHPNAHINAPSYLIAHSRRQIFDRLGNSIIVAYADEACGEIGIIYQSANALYTGKTAPKGQANYIIDGKRYSAWQIRKKYGTRNRKILKKRFTNLIVEPLTPKHRYVIPSGHPSFRRYVRRQLSGRLQPYPKRA